ncbi:MAG: XTP/dITP diphosphatase [Chitinophagales bacterium]
MSLTLVITTRNQNKKRELLEILNDRSLKLLTLEDFPNVSDIVEDGSTFKENAIKKATTVAAETGKPSLADDSGLEVDALNGMPGVYSARFAGEPSDDIANNNKLLQLLEGVPGEQRTARFKCVIALAVPNGEYTTVEGSCEGSIGFRPKGSGGFGYDPLFTPKGYELTFAELGSEVKNQISHRARALYEAGKIIIDWLEKNK